VQVPPKPTSEPFTPNPSSPGERRSAPAPGARLAAVREALTSSEEAARRGDYRSACAWLNVVEAVGGELPAEYLAKRRVWASAVEAERYAGAAARAAAALAASVHTLGRGAFSRLRGARPPADVHLPGEARSG
jgi:hypothetical protein